jgi:hypothetical protein
MNPALAARVFGSGMKEQRAIDQRRQLTAGLEVLRESQ